MRGAMVWSKRARAASHSCRVGFESRMIESPCDGVETDIAGPAEGKPRGVRRTLRYTCVHPARVDLSGLLAFNVMFIRKKMGWG